MATTCDRRALLTGAGGFVGPYVVTALREVCAGNVEIVGSDRRGGAGSGADRNEALDVTDRNAVRQVISRHRPTHVLHLAGIAAPKDARRDPDAAWTVHVQGALNVAHAILSEAPDCWLLHVGSGLVYGESARQGAPLDEASLPAPTDDYAVTKAAADLAVGALAQRGLKVVRLRPFNHTGPGQNENFVVPAFAAQVARIESGLAPRCIRVGNLDAERDFLDVRDVANAYALAACRTHELKTNTIFNVASGVGRRISDVLEWFLRHGRVPIAVERDQTRLRPSELPRIVGNSARIRNQLAWAPQYSWERTLSDVLAHHRRLAQL